MIVRMLPLSGVIGFTAVGLVWRAWLQYRRFGQAGIMLFQSGRPAQHMRDALAVLLPVLVFAQAIAYAINPARLAPLALLPFPTGGAWLTLGAVLVFGGTVLMVAAQLQLGASWRVGIEEGARSGLVTDGLYRFSRNPIFLAMFVVFVGLTVWLPTWPSALLTVGTVFGVRAQVLDEERYLQRAYGDAYRSYTRRVGRFVPRLGRVDA